jgi:hypothetical protein
VALAKVNTDAGGAAQEAKAVERDDATKEHAGTKKTLWEDETPYLLVALFLLMIVLLLTHHSEAPTNVEVVFHQANEVGKCVLQRRIDRMLGMGRSSDVAGDGPASQNNVQGNQEEEIPPESPPLPFREQLRRPVKEQKELRPYNHEELRVYLKRLWKLY